MVDANAIPLPPSSPFVAPEIHRIVRRLVPNLPSTALFKKIREAERFSEAGDRELAFYLNDLRTRKLYRQANCTSFPEFIRKRTGLTVKKAGELARAGKALESLPAIDEAFARGEIHWSSVRAMVAVATPQTDRAWAEFANSRSSHAFFFRHHDLLYLHSPHFSDNELQVLVLEMLPLLWYLQGD